MIDNAAKEFVAEIEAEEKRITKLVGDHAAEVARIKREKEAEERRLMDEARAKREAEEAAAAKAASTGKISDIIAARKAEEERREALSERMEASAEVASTRVAEGVRFAWDFEIVSIQGLYQKAPALVKLEVKRAELLAMLKDLETTYGDDQITDIMVEYGVKAFKKAVVSSR
jgi:DnaJ family protein C protein 2